MTKEIFNRDRINNNSGHSQSLWMAVRLPSFSPLNSNMNTDVCIVGAGIVGLTCAYTLAKEGKSVIVLDQSSLAGGQTARTTAHLNGKNNVVVQAPLKIWKEMNQKKKGTLGIRENINYSNETILSEKKQLRIADNCRGEATFVPSPQIK